MKRFVGISSILLLSSMLANTGTSLVLAKETKEEAKVVDTTKDKKEKTSSSKEEESDTKEKEAREVENPSTETSTIESSAVEEVNGTPQLQDPTKDLMDKITDSTKEDKDTKEETSKEDKKLNPLLKRKLGYKFGTHIPQFTFDDWQCHQEYNGAIILDKYIGKKTRISILGSVNTFWGEYNIYISKNALKGNNILQEIYFTQPFNYESEIWDPDSNYLSNTMDGMFSNMSHLKKVDFSGIDTRRINDFSKLFMNDTNLSDLENIKNLDVNSGINFSYLFKGCTSLKTVDLSGVNFADNKSTNSDNYTNFTGMFEDCTNIYQVSVGNIPNNVVMDNMFSGCTVLFANLQFRRDNYLASSAKSCFYVPYSLPSLPLLIQSNSNTFLNKEKTWKQGYYTYKDFAGDGRVLPCIITSGPNGMFADVKDGKYHGKYGTFPVTFDIPGKEYDPKDHWHNAKISMVLTTNGYATKTDPTDSLKKAQTTIKLWEKNLKAFPVLHSSDAPYYIEDKSQFYNGYFADQSDDRWKPWAKTFANIPDYLKNIFLKEEAQYAPVNPEMEKGHVIDSKNPNGKVWPNNRMPQGRLGFTYQPATVTSDITLQEAGQPLSGQLQVDGRTKSSQDDGLFHVGIRDFEKRDDNTNVGPKWTLNAKYHATNPLFRGSYIGFDQNTVRFNLNNINNKTNKPVPFNVNQLASSYKPNPNGNKVISLKGVTSTSQRKLPDGKSIQLMTSNGNQIQQFYDFTLGNLTLNIPQDHGITPQKDPTTVGQIDWNLTTGPNGN